jgi:hypothetical protein
LRVCAPQPSIPSGIPPPTPKPLLSQEREGRMEGNSNPGAPRKPDHLLADRGGEDGRDPVTLRHLNNYYIHIYSLTTQVMAHSPCFTPLANSLLLTWKPSFGVMRSCPPRPQVTRKLTSLFPSPPHSLPIPNSRPPGVFLN